MGSGEWTILTSRLMRIVKVLLGSGWRSSDQDVTSFLATKVERTESRSGEGSAGLLSETGYGPDYRFGKRPVRASDVVEIGPWPRRSAD